MAIENNENRSIKPKFNFSSSIPIEGNVTHENNNPVVNNALRAEVFNEIKAAIIDLANAVGNIDDIQIGGQDYNWIGESIKALEDEININSVKSYAKVLTSLHGIGVLRNRQDVVYGNVLPDDYLPDGMFGIDTVSGLYVTIEDGTAVTDENVVTMFKQSGSSPYYTVEIRDPDEEYWHELYNEETLFYPVDTGVSGNVVTFVSGEAQLPDTAIVDEGVWAYNHGTQMCDVVLFNKAAVYTKILGSVEYIDINAAPTAYIGEEDTSADVQINLRTGEMTALNPAVTDGDYYAYWKRYIERIDLIQIGGYAGTGGETTFGFNVKENTILSGIPTRDYNNIPLYAVKVSAVKELYNPYTDELNFPYDARKYMEPLTFIETNRAEFIFEPSGLTSYDKEDVTILREFNDIPLGESYGKYTYFRVKTQYRTTMDGYEGEHDNPWKLHIIFRDSTNTIYKDQMIDIQGNEGEIFEDLSDYFSISDSIDDIKLSVAINDRYYNKSSLPTGYLDILSVQLIAYRTDGISITSYGGGAYGEGGYGY